MSDKTDAELGGKKRNKSNDNEEFRLNRRSLLSRTAIGASAVVGLSGTAMAGTTTDRTAKKMVEQYRDDASVTQAFETHAGDLVTALSEEGVSHSDESVTDLAERATATRVGVVKEDGRPVTHLQKTVDVEDGEITAVVHRETGRSYALYRTESEEQPRIIDPNVEISAASSGCYVDWSECRDAHCDGWRDAIAGSTFNRITCPNVPYSYWSNTGVCCFL
jgi:hypothetical protein